MTKKVTGPTTFTVFNEEYEYSFTSEETYVLTHNPERYERDDKGNIRVFMIVIGYKNGRQIVCILNFLTYENHTINYLPLPTTLRAAIVKLNPNLITAPLRVNPDEVSYIVGNEIANLDTLNDIKP